MLKSLSLNLIIISLIIVVYYFNLLEFLTSNLFLWILFAFILILFAVAFKVLGNPFKAKSIEKETDKKE